MTEFCSRTGPAWVDTLVFASAAAILAIGATFVMFSAFMFYDDEGYVLLSLRNYAQHGALYKDVFSQYGPFPFVFYDGFQILGLPLTHTVGRLITIAAWGITAIACSSLAGLATRSLLARISTLTAVFLYLWVMAREPTHPGGIIIVLTSLSALLGYRWIGTERSTPWSLFVGAATAALLLTKVNIGIFAAFSASAWWLLHHRDSTLRGWSVIISGTCVIALPLVLMRPLLGVPWVQIYALVFASSGVAVILATSVGSTGRVGWPELRHALLSGGAVAGAVIGMVLLRSTSISDLAQGVLLGPLRQPTNFSLRFVWPDGVSIAAVASLGGCIIACLLRNRFRPVIDGIIAVLRLLCAVALAINILRFPMVSPDYLAFGSALPCLWFFVWPFAGGDKSSAAARAWVVLLLLGQCLHVFPVPGSQIAWGSFLMIPLAAMGGWEAARWLARSTSLMVQRRLATGSAMLVLVFTAATAWSFGQLAARYRDGKDLALPGAELIRVPDESAALYRLLTHNAVAHADLLFSLPGMFSFNLWSGIPTPTLANVTHWFSLLDEQQQRSIVTALEAHPRACVIVQREHIDFLVERDLGPKGLLYDYVTREFEPAFSIGGVEFSVRRGRKIKPFMIAEILTRVDNSTGEPSESTLLTFTLLLPPARPMTSIQVSTGPYSESLLELNAVNARVEFSPVDGRGEQSGPRTPVSWPLHISAAGTLWVYYNGEALPRPGREATIVLRASGHEEVGLARLSAP